MIKCSSSALPQVGWTRSQRFLSLPLCQGMLLQPHTLGIYTHTAPCTWKITYPLLRATPFMLHASVQFGLGPALPKITEKLWDKCIHSLVHQTTELNFSFTLYGLHYTENPEMQNLKRIENKNMKRILIICIFVKYLLLCLRYWWQSSEDKDLSLTKLQDRMKIRITIAAELFPASEFHSEWSSEALTQLVLSCRLQHSTIFELHPQISQLLVCVWQNTSWFLSKAGRHLHVPLTSILMHWPICSNWKYRDSSGELLKWAGWSC